MHELDVHDIQAIQSEAREDWEFRHHGVECPFTEVIGAVPDVDGDLAWEIDLERRLNAWA